MVQIQRFSESLEGARSGGQVCENPKFGTGHNFLFSGKDHGLYIIQAENRLFNTSYERPLSLSKLSGNHQINVIGPMELKLWPLKDAVFNARSRKFV